MKDHRWTDFSEACMNMTETKLENKHFGRICPWWYLSLLKIPSKVWLENNQEVFFSVNYWSNYKLLLSLSYVNQFVLRPVSMAALPFPCLQSKQETQNINNIEKYTVVKTRSNNTGHWEYTETFSEFGCTTVGCWHHFITVASVTIHFTRPRMLCVCVVLGWVSACVACDRTKNAWVSRSDVHAKSTCPLTQPTSVALPFQLCQQRSGESSSTGSRSRPRIVQTTMRCADSMPPNVTFK